ncbi:MAG: ABC transporter permease [Acidimicrobiales bacterium]
MLRLTFGNLWAHKRRLTATVAAVALGVAFLTGTLVLGDTMRGTFSALFERANAGTDVVVQMRSIDLGLSQEQGTLDASLVDRVRAVDGVATAEPVAEGYGRIVGRDGRPIGGQGPPTMAGTWTPAPFNPYVLAEGRAPSADDEVVINRAAAHTGNLAVGDTATVETPTPVPVKVVGIATFGEADSAGGSTIAAFTLAGAQHHLLGDPSRITSVVVRAQPGVTPTALRDRLLPLAPDGAEVVTGAELTARQQQGINADFLDVLTTVLTAFAAVAVGVAAFGIANTFSMLVAQRTREWALLRALGAGRRQILGATLAEALAVGVLASVVGVAGGIVIAIGLKAAFAGMGMDVPATGLVVAPSVAVVGLVVGIGVTMLAAVLPARRAARVTPMEALRESAVEPTGIAWRRAAVGAVLLAGGVVLGIAGRRAGVFGTTALGGGLTVLAAVVLGPVIARTAGPVVGWPLRIGRSITGELATENARRNPRRTAATASALMVGVAVVSLFTVLASSLRASVDASVERSFGGDLVVTSGDWGGSSGFSPQVGRDIAARPEVKAAAGMGVVGAFVPSGAGSAKGQRDLPQHIGVADPAALDQVLDLGVTAGSVADLGPDQLALSTRWAQDRNLGLGSEVPLRFVDGTTATYRVGALYTAADVAGDVAMSRAAWAPHSRQDLDVTVLVRLADGVTLDQGRKAVEQVLAPYAGTQVQDRQQYLDAIGQGIDQTLGLVYVLLVLAVVIALMGIANTLALSIHERTRELGLLRAVGQTRRQVRRMVRGESVVIAVLGTAMGLGLGVLVAWLLIGAAGAGSSSLLAVFRIAPAPLAVVLAAGAGAGLLASWRAARRAARLDVLAALTTT